MSTEPDNYGLSNVHYNARATVNLPATFLIVLGVLNLLLGLYVVYNAAQANRLTEDEFETMLKEYEKWYPGFTQQYRASGKSFEEIKGMVVTSYYIWGGVELGCALLILLGGVRMRALQSYGLAMTGSILAALPCFSCAGCCGVGQVVGIWSIVVLFNPEVRAAFQAGATQSLDGPGSTGGD
jgi:hypothetical protein